MQAPVGVGRTLHFIGLAMFLGSVAALMALRGVPGADGDPRTIATLREASVIATQAVAVPGLVLLFVTGIWLTMVRYGGFFKVRWLTLHQVIAVLVGVGFMAVLQPAGVALLDAARELELGHMSLAGFQHLSIWERIVGPICVVLTLATLAVAVVRPRFGKTLSGR